MADDPNPDPLAGLVEEFLRCHREGNGPTPSEFAMRHPARADEILEIFPLLLKMEKVRPELAELKSLTSDSRRESNVVAQPYKLGDYRIVREIGRGGMGRVYEAEQVSLGRRVALKILSSQALPDSSQVKRFEREARAAGRLHHTNIVPVFGFGHDDNMHYYIMQLIDGNSLDRVLAALRRLRDSVRNGQESGATPTIERCEGSTAAERVAQSLIAGQFTATIPVRSLATGGEDEPPVSRTSNYPLNAGVGSKNKDYRGYVVSIVRIGVQVADVLAYAASQGIIHRDIKPSNLLIDRRGDVWVTDFGLAKAEDQELTRPACISWALLRYMGPGQLAGALRAEERCLRLGRHTL